MAKIKLTKTAVDAATPKDRDYELHDTLVPGFMLIEGGANKLSLLRLGKAGGTVTAGEPSHPLSAGS